MYATLAGTPCGTVTGQGPLCTRQLSLMLQFLDDISIAGRTCPRFDAKLLAASILPGRRPPGHTHKRRFRR